MPSVYLVKNTESEYTIREWVFSASGRGKTMQNETDATTPARKE